MRKLEWICFLLGTLLVLVKGAWAAEVPVVENDSQIVSEQIGQKDGKILADLIVSHVSDFPLNFQVLDADNKKPSFEVELKPVRLWILVDIATQCSTRNLPFYLNHLFNQIRANLHPDSVVTLGGYARGYRQVWIQETQIKNIKQPVINCRPDLLSVDYSSLLTKMGEESGQIDLPTYAWVFGSGNMVLSPEAIQQVNKNSIKIRFFLYNSLILEPARSAAEQLDQRLGQGKVSLIPLNPEKDAGFVPEVFYTIKIKAPLQYAGQSRNYSFQAHTQKGPVAQGIFQFQLPERMSHSWLQRNFRWMILGTLVIMMTLVVWLGIRIYRPITCTKCKRYVKRQVRVCLFCRSKNEPIVKIVRHSSLDHPEQIYPIQDGQIELGTHKKSPLPIFKKPKELGIPFLRIEQIEKGRDSYHLKKLVSDQVAQISIQGELIREHRLLANGDVVRVRDLELVFYCGEMSDGQNKIS